MVKEYHASDRVCSREPSALFSILKHLHRFISSGILKSGISVGKMAGQTQGSEPDENLPLRYFSVFNL